MQLELLNCCVRSRCQMATLELMLLSIVSSIIYIIWYNIPYIRPFFNK